MPLRLVWEVVARILWALADTSLLKIEGRWLILLDREGLEAEAGEFARR